MESLIAGTQILLQYFKGEVLLTGNTFSNNFGYTSPSLTIYRFSRRSGIKIDDLSIFYPDNEK